MSETRYYYPPGSSPQSGQHCGIKPDWWDDAWTTQGDGKCKLQLGHEGKHEVHANWSAHVEVDLKPEFDDVEIAFRSWHDTRSLLVRSRAEADELLKFLGEAFDAMWGKSEADLVERGSGSWVLKVKQ